jgi:hypothetical protein
MLAVFTVAAIAVQGYHPAVEDAEIYAPGILKALHPSLFPYNSQFFQSHASMTIFPNLVAGSIRLTHLPAWRAFLAWQIITSFLLLWACLRIARLCFAEDFAVWCGVALTASLFALPWREPLFLSWIRTSLRARSPRPAHCWPSLAFWSDAISPCFF